MEHVTEGLFLAVSAGLFVLALSLLLLVGRSVDGLFVAAAQMQQRGTLIYEDRLHE